MFTIEVKKRRRDERFSFKDIVKEVRTATHEDCEGGKVKVNYTYKSARIDGWDDFYNEKYTWVLSCQRCNSKIRVEVDPIKIIKIAISGEEIKLGASGDVVVRQKS